MAATVYPSAALTSNSGADVTVSASTFYDGTQAPWKAFDNTPATQWGSMYGIYADPDGRYLGNVTTVDKNGVSYVGEWLQMDLVNATTLSSYSITPATWMDDRRSPKKFWLLGSPNGSSDWTLLDSRADVKDWSVATKTFSVALAADANYYSYRLVINSIGNFDTDGWEQRQAFIGEFRISAAVYVLKNLSFFDDGKFIRFNDAKTGDVKYYAKGNATFVADASSFTIMNGDARSSFPYDLVNRPASTSFRNLMEIFQAWVEAGVANEEDGVFVSDNTSTMLEVKTFYDNDPLRIEQFLVNGGTSTYDAGYNGSVMSITTAGTSRAMRTTHQYAYVLNNKMTYGAVAGTLVSSTSARNVVSRVGCYDDNADNAGAALAVGNGVFFQWTSGVGLAVVLRSNYTGAQVDVVVPQAQWSVDTLDGNGSSLKTLDPTVENTFVFEWSPLGGSIVRAGYLQDGAAIWCHRFTNVRLGCASVPIRWDIRHLDANLAEGSNDAASMRQGPASIMVRGSYDAPMASRAFPGSTFKAVTPSKSYVALLVIRPSITNLRRLLRVSRLFLTNLDQGLARWSLVLNPTFITVNYNVNTSGVAVTEDVDITRGSGIVLQSGFLTQGQHVVDLGDKSYALCGSFQGGQDQACVVVEYLRGTVTAAAAIEWVECE